MGFLDSIKRLFVEEKESAPQTEAVDTRPEAFEPAAPRHITAEEFETLKGEGVLVVDFWAEWCAPCHVLAPSIDRLAEEYGDVAVIAKLNVDEHPTVAGNLGIMGIPTVIVFKNGQEVQRFVGVQPYERLAQAVEAALAE